MANQTPSFITGGSAKLKLGGATLAYTTNVSYTVDVETIPIEVIGAYEVLAYEPIGYTVSGSFSIIKYTKAVAGAAPAGANGGGNSVTLWDAATKNQLNPGQILTSLTMDMEIFQKHINNPETDDQQSSVIKVFDVRISGRSGGVNERGVLTETFNFVGVLAEDDTFDASNAGDADLT